MIPSIDAKLSMSLPMLEPSELITGRLTEKVCVAICPITVETPLEKDVLGYILREDV